MLFLLKKQEKRKFIQHKSIIPGEIMEFISFIISSSFLPFSSYLLFSSFLLFLSEILSSNLFRKFISSFAG